MTRTLAALVVAAACDSAPSLDDRAAAIVGGTLAVGDDAVLALGSRARACGTDPQVSCTGALIAPRAVLTAAHCVTGESPASLVAISGLRVDDGARLEIDAIEVHPAYDGVSADLAILTLAEPLAPVPLPIRRTPIDATHVGDSVRVVGFGVDDDGITGIKRHGTARITEVTAATIVLGPDPALTCNADSGGPVLLGNEIVGVVSFGDPACATSATSTRADLYYDTFIAPALSSIEASATMTRAPLDATAPACTACERTEDCPRGTECVDGTCAVLGIGRGVLGERCTDEATCGSGICLAGLDETACRCVEACDDRDGCGCTTSEPPSGMLLLLAVLIFHLRVLRGSRGTRIRHRRRAESRAPRRQARISSTR